MMKRILFTLALLAATASSVSAADRWGRPSYGHNCYQQSYGMRFHAFPQQNTYIYQQELGSGITMYSTGPLMQYGADAPLYVPLQRAYNAPRGFLGRW